MGQRHPTVSGLKGRSPYLVGLLGLLARMCEWATALQPTRDDWEQEFSAFLKAQPQSELTRQISAERVLSAIVAGQKRNTDHGVKLLEKFLEGAFRGELKALDNTRGRQIVEKVLPQVLAQDRRTDKQIADGVGVIDGIITHAHEDNLGAEALCLQFARGLSDFGVNEWAPGLRMFEWPSIATGFTAYPELDTRQSNGLFLIVRQARGWSTADTEGERMLVRDLLWLECSPDEPFETDEAEVFGVYLSVFNSTLYQIQQYAAAGQWSRAQGPPINVSQTQHEELEVAAPDVSDLSRNPSLAMMTAHARDDLAAGAWKALVARMEESDWEARDNLRSIEADLKMFYRPGVRPSAAAVEKLLDHFKRRGIIGALRDQEAVDLFLRLVRRVPEANVRAKLEAVFDAAPPGQPPIETILAAWAEVEPAQMILPSASEAELTGDDAELARRLLFGQTVFGPDRVIADKHQFAQKVVAEDRYSGK